MELVLEWSWDFNPGKSLYAAEAPLPGEGK
jgi:hypothetical protein